MKVCTKCKEKKELSEFTKNAKSKDGVSYECKSCSRARNTITRKQSTKTEKQRLYCKNYRKSVRQSLYNYMQDKSCILCKEANIACLQFDHRDSDTKTFNIPRAISAGNSWLRVLEEISKCDILCANCHSKRTAIQQGWYSDLD